ncbi:MAG TPA: hypothetical protein VGK79_16395 [Gaiellaceae bacterium]
MSRASMLGALALAAIGFAWALPLQSAGCAQTAHYAGIRAIANGVPYIDRWTQQTCDAVRSEGHVYAAKGPLLDLWTAPWYMLLHAVGAVPPDRNVGMRYPNAMVGVQPRALWQMNLWAVVLPGLLLLVLVRKAAERIEPGTGVAVAATLGLGTLVLPYSTLLFSHVPAAMLLFAGFVLLFRGSPPLVAGICAGLAVAAEPPVAIPAVVVGLYAASRAPRVRRVVLFGVGGIVGLAPLWAFDIWAFGNPLHLGYTGTPALGTAGGWQYSGFFGQTMPSFRIIVWLLLSQRGLLVLTPVLALAAVGGVLLWRRGLRHEAALLAALVVVELIWNSARHPADSAMGGWVPGPRFLIPLLPFLCVALAPVVRRAPATFAALAAVSIGAMVIATSAEPLLSNDDTHHWIARIVDGNFTDTVLSLGTIGHGWLAILPFYAFVLAALACAVAATPRFAVTRRDLATAAAAVVAWIVVEHGAPELLRVDALVGEAWGTLAALVLIGGASYAVLRLRPEGLLLLPLLVLAVDRHTKVALLVAVVAAVALTTRPAMSRSRTTTR